MNGFWTVVAACVLVLGSAAASGHECDEEVLFEVYDGTIEVIHNQSLYNCCCWIEFDVAEGDFAIDVVEWEVLDAGGCDCLCCFDLRIAVAGLEPGDYTVTIWKHSEYGGVEMLGPWVVTVAGTSLPSLTTAYLPCVNTSADEWDEFRLTWGTIKELYR